MPSGIMASDRALVLVLFSLFLISASLYLSYRRKQAPLPPGPSGIWIFGPKIPLVDPFRAFERWSHKYGPVFSIRRGFNDVIVVIGGYKEAMEIMEKDGGSLADRPRAVAAGEYISNNMRTLIMNQGPRLNKYRKAFHGALQPKVAVNYGMIQQKNAHKMILNILETPNNHNSHAAKYAAETIIAIAYGLSSLPHQSKPRKSSLAAISAEPSLLQQIIDRVQLDQEHLVYAIRPGMYTLLETFPSIIERLPKWLYPSIKQLEDWHNEELKLFTDMVDGVRNSQESDVSGKKLGYYREGYSDVQASFTAQILDRQAELEMSDDEVAYLAGSMFGAGSETTASAITFVIMAAACFHGAQERVQAEIDAIIGKDRIPTYQDESILPQVTAFYLESYRWRPVSAGGFAHKATKDIHWNGYVIPKGASVFGHHWTIGRSPELFPDPELFDPQRWLVNTIDPETENTTQVITESIKPWNFGFGRRVCPGSHVANRSLFTTTALLLWAFNIEEDPEHPIDTLAFTPHANVRPLPFKVKFTPRIPVEDLKRLLTSEVF